MYLSVYHLLLKEIRLEFRNKASLGSLLVYVLSTVFVCYRSFLSIQSVPVWNALFWIIILFAVVNAVSRSFYNENRSLQLYYYQLVSPAAVILSKILFNYLLVILLCLITLPVYTLFLGSPDADWLPFLLVVILSAGAFSSAFTLISAIAAKGNNAAGLTPVLGFPVIIPLLLITIKASGNALDALDFSVYSDTVIVLVLFNVVLTAMAYLLFPYLWRE